MDGGRAGDSQVFCRCAHLQTGEELSATSSLQNLGGGGAAGITSRPSSASGPQVHHQQGSAAAVEGSVKGPQLFNDASAEIADIDSRLHALQNFLRMAKASAPSSSAHTAAVPASATT